MSQTSGETPTQVLVIDIGGTSVKVLRSGESAPRHFPSGPKLSPSLLVETICKLVSDRSYDSVAIGYPGRVLRGTIVAEPHHLAPGWVGFDFERAFRQPVKIVNDAAMQALGSYRHGTMLFLGLGTGLGSALVVNGNLVPMELAGLPFRSGTLEDYVGKRGLHRLGTKRWRKVVGEVFDLLISAVQFDELVVGGGNVTLLTELPPISRRGDNACAFLGGFRLWGMTSSEIGSAVLDR